MLAYANSARLYPSGISNLSLSEKDLETLLAPSRPPMLRSRMIVRLIFEICLQHTGIDSRVEVVRKYKPFQR